MNDLDINIVQEINILHGGKYQVMPDMTTEQFEALRADILERGVLTPIDIDEEGTVLDGHHRLKACKELNITDYPTIIRPGLTEEQKRIFARKSNMMRRHLNRKQIQGILKNQLIDTPDWADNRIGQELGIDGKTVRTMRLKLESTSEIPKLEKLKGIDGKERPVKKPAIMVASERERDKILQKLKDSGFDISKLPSEFIEGGNTFIFFDPGYDPFYGVNEEQMKEWKIFQLFLLKKRKSMETIIGVNSHIEWIRQHSFITPSEWLGEIGQKWRKSVYMNPCPKALKPWEDYLNKELALEQKIEFTI